MSSHIELVLVKEELCVEKIPIYFVILFPSFLTYIVSSPMVLNVLIYHRVNILEILTAISFSLTFPITVFLLTKISQAILYANPLDLPFFVRFVKFKRFWFVLLSIGLEHILLLTLLANEKIFKIIYFILWLDLFTLWMIIIWRILIHSTKVLPDTPL